MQFQILLTYLQGKVLHPLKEKPKNPNKQSERRTNIAKTR